MHGVLQVRARLEVVFPPSCQIQLREKSTAFTLRCRAEGNPRDFSFSWLKNNLSFSDQNQITLKENSNFGKYPKRNVQKLKISNIFTCESSTTVLETLFDTIALNDDYSIKYSSNLKSNGSFEQLV